MLLVSEKEKRIVDDPSVSTSQSHIGVVVIVVDDLAEGSCKQKS